jgi:hypothetical protein
VIQIQKFVQELAARGDELLDHHTSAMIQKLAQELTAR